MNNRVKAIKLFLLLILYSVLLKFRFCKIESISYKYKIEFTVLEWNFAILREGETPSIWFMERAFLI